MMQWPDLKREKNDIDGEWVSASTGKTVDVHDPSTGAVIGAKARSTVSRTI